jgi:hypothetical protein
LFRAAAIQCSDEWDLEHFKLSCITTDCRWWDGSAERGSCGAVPKVTKPSAPSVLDELAEAVRRVDTEGGDDDAETTPS